MDWQLGWPPLQLSQAAGLQGESQVHEGEVVELPPFFFPLEPQGQAAAQEAPRLLAVQDLSVMPVTVRPCAGISADKLLMACQMSSWLVSHLHCRLSERDLSVMPVTLRILPSSNVQQGWVQLRDAPCSPAAALAALPAQGRTVVSDAMTKKPPFPRGHPCHPIPRTSCHWLQAHGAPLPAGGRAALPGQADRGAALPVRCGSWGPHALPTHAQAQLQPPAPPGRLCPSRRDLNLSCPSLCTVSLHGIAPARPSAAPASCSPGAPLRCQVRPDNARTQPQGLRLHSAAPPVPQPA